MSQLATINNQIAAAQRIRPSIRSLVALIAAKAENGFVAETFERLYGSNIDKQTRNVFQLVTRAASTPHTMGNTTALTPNIGNDIINFLVPSYAAAKILSLAMPADPQSVVHQLFTPTASDGSWSAEGAAIKVAQFSLSSGVVMDANKFATIVAFTNEIANFSLPSFEAVVEEGVKVAIGCAFDTALFSTDAASAVCSAGLLQGLSPITASVKTGELAMLEDISNVLAVCSLVSANSRMVLVTDPARTIKMKLYGSRITDVADVYGSPVVADGTLIAVAPNAIAASITDAPRFEVSRETVLHMEDVSPDAVSVVGTPNAVSAPLRSLFQHDLLAAKIVMPCSWLRRSNQGVAFIDTGMNW